MTTARQDRENHEVLRPPIPLDGIPDGAWSEEEEEEEVVVVSMKRILRLAPRLP